MAVMAYSKVKAERFSLRVICGRESYQHNARLKQTIEGLGIEYRYITDLFRQDEGLGSSTGVLHRHPPKQRPFLVGNWDNHVVK